MAIRTLILAVFAIAFNLFAGVTAQCYYGLSTTTAITFCEKQTTTGCANGVTKPVLNYVAVSGGGNADVSRLNFAFADVTALNLAKVKLTALGYTCRANSAFANPAACASVTVCGQVIPGVTA
ncbi:hypothetical protein INT43_007420 [Umbelopsis isabellina]|uniref:Uncharacterized protein n=1 Tax=Mortierella isabellina TaxID=91625 RepID=A0A8H7PZE7_MORIS|nr:hypothetical protein INT43_007420 [Umbelopsis isabellina]